MTVAATRPITVKLDQSIHDRIGHLAEARRRTTHWLAREAIIQFVEREEKREKLRQDTLKAWEEYQRTGLYLTADEVDAWMAKLEAGEDVELPTCHI